MLLKSRKQNIVNLQSLLVKTGATTPMNLYMGDALDNYRKGISATNLAEECFDTNINNASDTGGDYCDWYWNNPDRCGAYDDNDFTASSLCCACGGGSSNVTEAVCEDTNDGYLDGGNDGCDWYILNPSSCGMHDTDFFFANKQCCACGGGSLPTSDEPEMICMDTNGELRDSTYDTCSWYTTNPSTCGVFDVEGGFNANEMCCGCGGGEYQEVVDTAVEEFVDGLVDVIDVTGDDGDSIG